MARFARLERVVTLFKPNLTKLFQSKLKSDYSKKAAAVRFARLVGGTIQTKVGMKHTDFDLNRKVSITKGFLALAGRYRGTLCSNRAWSLF